MSSVRIWLEPAKETDLLLNGAEYNHLANVLRVKVGEEIIAVSGDAYDRHFLIKNINKKNIELTFLSKNFNACNPTKNFTVYLALIKPEPLAALVPKLNEIGVTDLKLFTSALTAVSPKQINLARLNEIAKQSCKQCGRSLPMRVTYLADLISEDLSQAVFLDESAIDANTVNQANAIIVGPAGGFTTAERAQYAQIATAVNFGRRILRAETAALVGASKWCI